MEKQMNKPKVVRLYAVNPTDIRAMATRFGRNVQNGQYGEVLSVGVVVEGRDGSLRTFAWGESDRTRLTGILFAAASINATGCNEPT